MSNLEKHNTIFELLNEIEKKNESLKRHIDPIRSLLISDSELSFIIQEIMELYELMKYEKPSSENYKKYEVQLKSFFVHIKKLRDRDESIC